MCSQQITNQLVIQYQAMSTLTYKKRRLASQIIVKGENLIASRVKRYLGRGVDKDELMNCGRIGLHDALEKFDARKGTEISTFAVPKIDDRLKQVVEKYTDIHVPESAREALKDCAKLQEEQGPLSFQELGNQLGKDPKYIEGAIAGDQYRCVSLSFQDSDEDLLISSEASTTLDTIAVEQMIEEVLNDLPDKLVITVWLRVVEEKSFAEIARITGRAVRTVRSWCSKALEVLAHRLDGVLADSPF